MVKGVPRMQEFLNLSQSPQRNTFLPQPTLLSFNITHYIQSLPLRWFLSQHFPGEPRGPPTIMVAASRRPGLKKAFLELVTIHRLAEGNTVTSHKVVTPHHKNSDQMLLFQVAFSWNTDSFFQILSGHKNDCELPTSLISLQISVTISFPWTWGVE